MKMFATRNAAFFIAATLSCLVAASESSSCSDGYNLNYTLPMFEQCKVKMINGSKVQMIPKLIPRKFGAKNCYGRVHVNIPPGYRVCRIPDCLEEPCQNGWCQEEMTNYTCHCPPEFTGIHCESRIPTTQSSGRTSPSYGNTSDNPTTVTELSALSTQTETCLSNPCLHGGTCEEVETGPNCICMDGYHGQRCEYEAFIYSMKLLGGRGNQSGGHEGRLAFTSKSSPDVYFLIHQKDWKFNSSQLACRYLGFEGVFATVSGGLYDSSPLDASAAAVAVICPPNATDITECWHKETRVDQIDESIGIICCPVNRCNITGHPLGLESGTVPDSAISSSTDNGSSVSNYHVRLNGASAWVPMLSDANQWLQVQFESNHIVTAITTQGRPGIEQRVTSYTVSSSADNLEWTDYLNLYTGQTEVFPGNYDSDSHVTHALLKPIAGRSFRINPKTYMAHMALRLELYGYGPLTDVTALINQDAKLGCTPPVRGEGLGVEDGRIPDSSLTSSSNWGRFHEADRGRLNSVHNSGGVGAWVAADADPDKWVKVDLGEARSVTGVISQGRVYGNGQFVTSLRISYSMDNTNWTFALEAHCGVRKVYAANFDSQSYVTIIFPDSVTARYVRFHPVTYIRHASMRVEVLGINN